MFIVRWGSELILITVFAGTACPDHLPTLMKEVGVGSSKPRPLETAGCHPTANLCPHLDLFKPRHTVDTMDIIHYCCVIRNCEDVKRVQNRTDVIDKDGPTRPARACRRGVMALLVNSLYGTQ